MAAGLAASLKCVASKCCNKALPNAGRLDAFSSYIQDSIFFLSGTPPACTTLPSMTTPGVDMTP